jgi:hypothetical protein
MKKTLLAAAACCAVMAGCATDCGSDWYAIGQRDGRIGADSQFDGYAARCGGQVDRARYEEGLQAGQAMRPRVPSF